MQSLIFLNFHGIGEPARTLSPGEERVWVSVASFEAVLDLIAERLNAGLDDIQITFDDGNISDYAVAFPRLIDRGLRARFFIISERIGREQSLSPRHLREMRRAGMTIGTHGMCHIDWRRADAGALRAELVDARNLIEQVIGARVDEAAIPFGSYDRRVLRRLRGTDYVRAYTSDGGWTDNGKWLVPRCTIQREDDISSIRHLIQNHPALVDQAYSSLKQFVKRWR
jgi:peptidoglycan/xylan/chitin deacetylase (PgdA/CDA1 family)